MQDVSHRTQAQWQRVPTFSWNIGISLSACDVADGSGSVTEMDLSNLGRLERTVVEGSGKGDGLLRVQGVGPRCVAFLSARDAIPRWAARASQLHLRCQCTSRASKASTDLFVTLLCRAR